jgi:hypothetical protein
MMKGLHRHLQAGAEADDGGMVVPSDGVNRYYFATWLPHGIELPDGYQEALKQRMVHLMNMQGWDIVYGPWVRPAQAADYRDEKPHPDLLMLMVEVDVREWDHEIDIDVTAAEDAEEAEVFEQAFTPQEQS